MATERPSIDPKEKECSVCHDDFKTPKLLPCAHVICRDCLATWLTTGDNDCCPLCRDTILDPENSWNVCMIKSFVDALPTDYAMVALVESMRVLSRDHVCCVCEDVAATSLCLHCGDMLCQDCTVVHGKLKVSRHHKVEDLSSVTPERLSAVRPASCTAHSDRSPEFYCPNHAVPLCAVCACTDHKACYKQKFEDTVQTAENVLDQLVRTLKAGEDVLTQALTELDQHFADIGNKSTDVLAKIQEEFDRMECTLKQSRLRLEELIKGAQSPMEAEFRDGKALLTEKRGKLTSHRRVTERVQQTTPADSVEKMADGLWKRMTVLDTTASFPNKVLGTDLMPDLAVFARVEEDLASLGKLVYRPLTLLAEPAPVLYPASELDGSEVPEFRFHSNHGHDVSLGEDGRTVVHLSGTETMVLSCEPLMVNTLYEVQIVEATSEYEDLQLGITNKHPASLAKNHFLSVLQNSIMIGYDIIRFYGKQKRRSTIGHRLLRMEERQRAGVLVDSARRLHLFVNGLDEGVVVCNVTDPVYACFEICKRYKKVKACRPKRMRDLMY